MRRARCLSCESLDSSSGLTWPLPLAELSAWSVWKVSADLAGTVSCLGGGSSSVRGGTKDLVYARTSFQTCIWKAQSGVRGKFTIQGHKGSCAGGTRSGKREGRMEIAATRRSPRASHMPGGGLWAAESQPGDLVRRSINGVFSYTAGDTSAFGDCEGEDGDSGEGGRPMADFRMPFPCGTRGRESHRGLKAHGWVGMRRGRDSEAGHVLLGWARVKAWSCGGSRREPWEVALSWVTGACCAWL